MARSHRRNLSCFCQRTAWESAALTMQPDAGHAAAARVYNTYLTRVLTNTHDHLPRYFRSGAGTLSIHVLAFLSTAPSTLTTVCCLCRGVSNFHFRTLSYLRLTLSPYLGQLLGFLTRKVSSLRGSSTVGVPAVMPTSSAQNYGQLSHVVYRLGSSSVLVWKQC